MPVYTEVTVTRYDDGVLTIGLAPPTAIGGWDISFEVEKRFGGTSGLIVKSIASGYNGQSGITITNSGAGIFTVSITSPNVSGLDYGAYAYQACRLDSGFITTLAEGYINLIP